MKTKHDKTSISFSGYLFRRNFKKQDNYLNHINNHKDGLSFVLHEKSFDKTIQIFHKHFKKYFSHHDILNESEDIQSLIQFQLLQYPKCKVNFLIQIEYILKRENNLTLEKETFHIRTSNLIFSNADSSKSLKKIVNNHLFEIFAQEKDMNLPQSGWVSNKIIPLDVNLHKVDLLL